MKKALERKGQHLSQVTSQSSAVKFRLPREQIIRIHELMLRNRLLEERLIKMYKQSDGYFWLGGPGEEAFAIPLGLQVQKGQGLDYDYFHLHYRASGILQAMGMDPRGALRQMKNTASDPFSGGRNFVGHFSIREWNVVPVTSTIETQYVTAIGTAIAQKRHGGTGITIVTGGDAGTAEADFASCLVWASRPGNELPILIVVTNNGWGISTDARTQHGERHIADRGRAFGMKCMTIDGNDMEGSWFAIKEAMDHIRTERKPVLLEARVSRLYGHSSASGANFHPEEEDPLLALEKKIEGAGFLTRGEMDALRETVTAEYLEMAREVKQEPLPDGSTIHDHAFYGQKGRTW